MSQAGSDTDDSGKRRLPKRIILVRHGESLGNVDESAYATIPDWRIPLTDKGYEMAVASGEKILSILGGDKSAPLFFYCSPYLRTKQTLHGLLKALGENRIEGVREEPQLTGFRTYSIFYIQIHKILKHQTHFMWIYLEQQFGNFQSFEIVSRLKQERNAYGRFYYRFPEGESGLDVYNRVTAFIATLYREWSRIPNIENVTVIMVCHGLSLRLFIMRWFRYTVSDFENSCNPPNGAVIILNRVDNFDKDKSYFEMDEEGKQICQFQ